MGQQTIELDEMAVLRDQVASLAMKLAQAEQNATRHQAIANQLAQQLTESLAAKEPKTE